MYLAQQFNANVVGIDADASLAAYFALLAELNEVDTVAFQALRLETLTTGHFDGVHTVVGTDICFWDALVEPLFAMISAALDGGVRQILLSDPGRPPFWALAERCDAALNCELLPQHSGAPFNTTKPILIIEP